MSVSLIKKKFSPLLGSVLSIAVFFTFIPFSSAQINSEVVVDFTDVSRIHPYYVAISFLKEKDVVSGYDDDTFRSTNGINKAETTKVLIASIQAPLDAPFEALFSDVQEGLWYSPHVMKARALGFVKGNDTTNTFLGDKQVNLAEFLKMMLLANEVDVTSYEGKSLAPNISEEEWYASYINYALSLGIFSPNSDGTVDPAKVLTRGEVANMIYLMTVIVKGSDTPFLLSRSEAELAQIEVYIAANQVSLAKTAAELAVDFTQQAYKNEPEDNIVLGAGKIARAYDWLVDAFILGIEKKNVEAAQKANDVIDKATEAWEADNGTQPIAAHIKERAREILIQVGGVET